MFQYLNLNSLFVPPCLTGALMNMELFGSAQESKENKFYFYLDAFRSRQAARAVKITSANWITSKSQGGISTPL